MAFTIDLKEKVVLVTGVSSGIGLGVAREFARAGADVAGCSRKAANDESIVTYVEAVESEGSRGALCAGRCYKRAGFGTVG